MDDSEFAKTINFPIEDSAEPLAATREDWPDETTMVIEDLEVIAKTRSVRVKILTIGQPSPNGTIVTEEVAKKLVEEYNKLPVERRQELVGAWDSNLPQRQSPNSTMMSEARRSRIATLAVTLAGKPLTVTDSGKPGTTRFIYSAPDTGERLKPPVTRADGTAIPEEIVEKLMIAGSLSRSDVQAMAWNMAIEDNYCDPVEKKEARMPTLVVMYYTCLAIMVDAVEKIEEHKGHQNGLRMILLGLALAVEKSGGEKVNLSDTELQKIKRQAVFGEPDYRNRADRRREERANQKKLKKEMKKPGPRGVDL